MGTVTVGGVEFFFRSAAPESAGPGAPVLFAHCSLAHSGLWRPLTDPLAGERPWIAPDLPAHGRSAPPPPGVSLQCLAVDLCETLAERAAEAAGRPVHLVGLSLGAATLGRLALRRPDLVASAALFEPVWFHLLRAGGRIAEAAEEEAAIAATAALRGTEGPEAEIRAFMDRWGQPGGWARMKPEAQAASLATFGHIRGNFDWVIGWPEGQVSLEGLAAMQPPTMLVHGARTPRPAAAVAELAAASIPGAALRVIEGAGHLSPVAAPRVALDLLRGFWAQVEGQAAA